VDGSDAAGEQSWPQPVRDGTPLWVHGQPLNVAADPTPDSWLGDAGGRFAPPYHLYQRAGAVMARSETSARGAGGVTLDKDDSEATRPSSPIEFRLDLATGVPTCLQLVHHVEHALRLEYVSPATSSRRSETWLPRWGHQHEHGAEGLREAGDEETRGSGDRAGERSSWRRSARWRCPSSPSSAALSSLGLQAPTPRARRGRDRRRSSRTCCGIFLALRELRLNPPGSFASWERS